MRTRFHSLAAVALALLVALLGLSSVLFGAGEERGLVAPPVLEVGLGEDLEKTAITGNLTELSLCSNLVFPGAASLRVGQTEASWGFAHDGHRLLAVLDTPAENTLKATYAQRDANLWEDDSCELFLTDESGKNGCHFIVNSRGALYDSKLVGGLEDSKWDSRRVQVRNHFPEKRWLVAFLVPFEELGMTADRRVLRCGFYRSSGDVRVPEGITQFSDVFYVPGNFAFLKLADHPQRLAVEVDTRKLSSGVLTASLAGSLPGVQGGDWLVGVTPLDYAVNDAFNQPKETIVAQGKVTSAANLREVTGEYKLPPAGIIHVLLKSGERTLFERRLSYGLADFSAFGLTSLYANAARTAVCAEGAVADQPAEYLYGLRDQRGKTVVSARQKLSGKYVLTLPLTDVPPEKYLFFLKAQDGREATGRFVVLPKHPEWLGNRLGFTEGHAPSPWSDIRFQDQQALVWNRTIAFDGMPVRMDTSTGTAVENIRFEAEERPLKCRRFGWTEQAGDVARFQAMLDFENGSLELDGTLEFDGLVWMDCHFVPRQGTTLPDLALKMEVPVANVCFVHGFENLSWDSRMLAPNETWHKDMLNHLPAFWVGMPERGICFLADDLRGWNLTDYSHSVQVTAEHEGRRSVTVPLLERKRNQAGESRRMSFALQATPTRPMPKGWRDFRVNGGDGINNIRLYQAGITCLFNVPVPVRRNAALALQEWRKKGVNALPYLAFLATSPFTDEYKFYSEQWRITPQRRPSLQPENDMTHTMVCPQGEGYTDYYLWNIDRMLDATGAEGLYFDYGQPGVYHCSNANHGCGWRDTDGNPRPSYRFRASREWVKRLYVLLKRKRPDGLLALHNSGGLLPAFHCLADITWNGEQLAAKVFHNGVSYRGLCRPERLMLEQNGEIWGVPAVFIPQFLRVLQLWDKDRYGQYEKIGWSGFVQSFLSTPEAQRDTWHLAGLLYLNNGSFSGDWGMGSRLADLHRILAEIGWDDTVRFWGWHDKGNPFRVIRRRESSPLLVSAYQTKGGWLVVAVNDSAQSEDLQISLPQTLREAHFTEQVTGQRLSPVEGRLEYRMAQGTSAFFTVVQSHHQE